MKKIGNKKLLIWHLGWGKRKVGVAKRIEIWYVSANLYWTVPVSRKVNELGKKLSAVRQLQSL